ncbi:MAG: tetratricopeptide repeat protein, partial [Thermoanaerobaculia bacterium]
TRSSTAGFSQVEIRRVKRRALLPVVGAPTIRPSRASRWRAAVLIAIHIAVAIHIAHWLIAGRTVTPVEPSEAMAFSKAGIVNAGLIFFAGAILITALFGRWFCGWACHLVALQDLCRWLLGKIGIRPRPLRSRLLGLVPYFAFAYMFLWPAIYRLWIGDSLGVRGAELTTSAFWETFPGWVVGVLTLVICGFATVYFLGAKGFCTYACPYGAAFSLAEKLSPLRVRVNEDCDASGHCTSVCTSNVRVHEEVRDYGMVIDSGCMKCGDCVSVCPNDALSFGFGKLPIFLPAPPAPPAPPTPPGPDLGKRSYPLSWREECILGIAFILAFASFRGLYGDVPFLMSLGLAGVLAFLVLLAVRLISRRDLAFRHRTLKRAGRLLPAGRAFAAALGLLGLLWAWSAWLQMEVLLAQRSFATFSRLRPALLEIASVPPAATAGERAAALAAVRHFGRVERWGLFRWRGLASNLAWSAWIGGDTSGFRHAVGRALARHESEYQMLLLTARDAAAGGDLATLTLAGERAIALDPKRLEAYSGVGILLAQAGSPTALTTAASFLERGMGHFPSSTVLAYNLAIIHAMQGDPERAIERFRQVLRFEPGHREARENLAGMLAQSGQLEEAAVLYREAIAASPEDPALHVLLAQVWMTMGRDEAARAELAAALRIEPGHRQARDLAAALAQQAQ